MSEQEKREFAEHQRERAEVRLLSRAEALLDELESTAQRFRNDLARLSEVESTVTLDNVADWLCDHVMQVTRQVNDIADRRVELVRFSTER